MYVNIFKPGISEICGMESHGSSYNLIFFNLYEPCTYNHTAANQKGTTCRFIGYVIIYHRFFFMEFLETSDCTGESRKDEKYLQLQMEKAFYQK